MQAQQPVGPLGLIPHAGCATGCALWFRKLGEGAEEGAPAVRYRRTFPTVVLGSQASRHPHTDTASLASPREPRYVAHLLHMLACCCIGSAVTFRCLNVKHAP